MQEENNLAKVKIIIIDDELDFAETLSEEIYISLESENIIFQDLDSALPKIQEGWPSIILSDVFMTTGSGLRLTSELEKIKLDIPVIYITGMLDSLPNKENVTMLRKPINMDILLKTIKQKLA